MKKTRLIIVLVIAAVLAIIAVVMFLLFSSNSSKRKAPVVEFSRSFGGDMEGGHSHLSIKKLDEEKALVISSSGNNFTPTTVEEYYVPLSVLDSIGEVYDKYKIQKFQSLPENPVFAYDAGTTSYSFSLEDGTKIYFNDRKMITQKGYDGLHKIGAIILDAAKQGEKLPALVVGEEGLGIIEEGAAKLVVYEYCNNCLSFRLLNGLDENISINAQAILYRENNGAREEICRDGEQTLFADSNYIDTGCIFLDNRLSAAHYVLSLGEFEAEFDIA